MTANQLRLPAGPWGLLLDRERPVTFSFDGIRFQGFSGDVIASALMASGRHVLSRSFKYHRPRGALTMAGHDSNSLVQVGPEPNVRGDRHRIAEGIAVTSINRFGTLDRDWLALLGLFSRFLPVGFYYKTFFRPHGAWRFFEKPIRALAGLGSLDPKAPHGYFDKQYLFSDILVVGGGPAGLCAAIAAAEAGAETLLIDEWPVVGGSLLYGRINGSRPNAETRRLELSSRAEALPNLRVMTDTTVSGLFADNWALALKDNRLYKIRTSQTVLATGGYDQPIVFAANDLPGIMFADAAQRLMRLYGVKPGTRAVVATANRFGYDAALDLLDAGIAVAAVVDLRNNVEDGAGAAARARGIRIIPGSTLIEARGRRRVEAVAAASIIDRDRRGPPEWIGCDLVLMSAGYTPAINLACHTGAKVAYDPSIAMHRAADLPPGVSLAGSVAGAWSDDLACAHGTSVGQAAAKAALGQGAAPPAPVADATASDVTHPWPITEAAHGKDFIDFDEDLRTRDIVDSVHDGYDDIQLVKRYSTAGLGPSQGRHANLNTIRLVARETKRKVEAVGTTTFRPPLVPEKFGHLAGRGFEPTRLTAMHDRHLALGAQMMPAGLWLRPAYYGPKGNSAAVITAEVKAVRDNVGLIDVSTLGGFDIRGPDAAAFLDRIYTFNYLNQPVGRARYTLLTDETGVIIDDGVACRLHQQHFYVTATTGAADQVYRLMSFWNQQWRLDVDIAAVTAAYAGINIAGPRARSVIEQLESDIDFSTAAFPYLGVRTGHLAGIPVRVLRVGFVGELGYEIRCPSAFGARLWDRLMEAGKSFGIKPFGVEAQRVLRLEKGHIIVGQDTDGLTHPAEAGMTWALSKTKPAYLGKRSVDMQIAKGARRVLTGFTVAATADMPKENHLVIENGDIAGRVTSVALSPTLNKVIGLAYLPAGKNAVGARFQIRVDGGRMVQAEVVPTPFYDPEHKRQEM
ncbi:(2Fe-2S)-binding protein [Bradyrhizobium sp. BRP22]|uniref:2Fe-2S iron-sulfur cluster-binding protein n=1 Tax=Bradyrhizobium sp. BRP22 TaxID=2793821 RepID=UPI001CD3B84F|nr:2Fe-2S iron-sulfur cluster-binding protein [Bradyrhizobium sp. BRP22]MCA1452647.1 (2Fe-2S)-binding protein [Bradyrhizobium sp. BRP22]